MAAGAADAVKAQPGIEPVDHAVCRLIESASRTNHLPVQFFTRVIWRESSFRAVAVSPAGALGIAQFMPATAQARGLADPFDPEQAIPKAARLLADLRSEFGNLGLAAAAYNAGSGRVTSFLRGDGPLPRETVSYVRFVTQKSVVDWLGKRGGDAGASPMAATEADPQPAEQSESCVALTAELRRDRGHATEDDALFAPLAPWGVQLAGNFSKAVALASFERERQRYAAVVGNVRPMVIGRLLRSRGTRPFYQVRLPAASRTVADALCGRIRAVGGACVAMPS